MENTELFELVLKFTNQEKVAKLTADIEQSERSMADMAAAAGLMGQALPIRELSAFANKIAASRAELSKAQAAMNATADAERKLADKQAQAAARAEATAARKAAAAERAAKAAERAAEREAQAAGRAAKAADLEATRKAVAADKARSLADRGSSVDRDIERRLRRGAGGDEGTGGRRARLTGTDRAGAQSRLGLGVANMLQDTIQGGSPAYAINNILGMANDRGVKSLAAEGLEGVGLAGPLKSLGGLASKAYSAVGGLGGLATAFAGVAAAAGVAFLLIDGGLKSAGLGWGDFTTVLSNLGPISAAGEALEGALSWAKSLASTLGDTAIGAGLVAFVGSIGGSLSSAVAFVDEWTLGWGRATDAAKAHKDEIDRAVQSAMAYSAALKTMDDFKSTEQKQREATGKLVGQELANLGGAGGVEGLAAKLADKATARGGDDKVKVQEEILDKNGKGTGKYEEKEITRREVTRRDLMARMARAVELGDPNAIADIAQRVRGAGLDPSALLDASRGVDKSKADKAEAKSRAKEDAADSKLEADNLNREAREGKAAWEKAQADARKSKSFLGKAESEQTPAEKVAQAEYTRFEDAVGEATRNQSWLGLEDSELSPEQKEAKKRAGQREKAQADKVRGIKQGNPELVGLIAGSMALAEKTGGSMDAARSAIFQDLASAVGPEAARSLMDEAGGDARKSRISDLMNQETRTDPVKVIEGASALRDSIQSSVKQDEATLKVWREQVVTNEILRDLLQNGGLG